MLLHEDKVALVTGGASGIGRAAAVAFAREGARVVIADVAVEAGLETAQAIKAAGGDALFVEVDLLRPEDIRQMVATTVAAFGRLDVAFNNAGHRGGATTVVDCDLEEWDLVMGLNLRAVWLCMKYEIPEMLKAGGGAIVNTASGMANFAGPSFASYATSKAGVLGLTRAAAVDFGPLGIRVNALLPGATDTAMLRATMQDAVPQSSSSMTRIPLRRYSAAEEQAEAAVWLASERASFITGAQLVSDGGATALR
ncbi:MULTISPECIES: glucose 1-dehydrogenase [unclassified Phenylobacterium]|uniref:glucose 1-dehydrogenase n=1 Tax=unclassified Phenylobacterium TaxID=2640670 RepID=UPI00083ABDBE|nr:MULTISPECIES: glucose 1-dehydrogenase [unclassified Phenylobacterium]